MTLDPYIIHKNQSKRIRDLNVRHATCRSKTLEENTREKLLDINFGSNFLDITLKLWEAKAK